MKISGRFGSIALSLLMASALMPSAALAEPVAEPEGFMDSLKGTYTELFPAITTAEYDDFWVGQCAALVGDEAADASAAMLKSACTGTIYGQEAIDAYAADPDSAVFDCYFTNDVALFTFDGYTISGTGADGSQIFSHEYTYAGYNAEYDFYEYRTDEADSGEFTYFFMRPDTPESTYHIEFRYGSDPDALGAYYEGDYAYWMAAGILNDADDQMIRDCITLFCTENLSESETAA